MRDMMKAHESRKEEGILQETASRSTSSPPAYIEYLWYASIAYAMLGKVWGVAIPAIGGVLLALLAVASLVHTGKSFVRLYAPVAWGIGAGLVLILIQFVFHDTRSLDSSIVMSGWLSTIIIVQALSLRPGFLHRFALAASAIGVAVLPYLSIRVEMGSGPTRLGASGTGISNPNTLAMWFGFSVLFFLFRGIQSRALLKRVIYGAASLVCLYVVALTVSRGAILSLLVSCVVGFRSALKKNFVPVLVLVLMLVLIYASGAFQEMIDPYIARGAEESGRGKVWPLVVERILDSPWVGVGLDNIYTFTRGRHGHNPHNALLFFGLSAGIVPMLCFSAYLFKVGTGMLDGMKFSQREEDMLLPPLVTFALVEIMLADFSFMMQWVVVVFAFAAAKHSSIEPRAF